MNRLPSALPDFSLQQDLYARAQTLQKRFAISPQKGDGQKQALAEGIAQLESLFIFQLLQTMRKTVPNSGLFEKGFVHDLYHSLFDQEIAQQIARRGGLGLQSFLLQQFADQPQLQTQERRLSTPIIPGASLPPAKATGVSIEEPETRPDASSHPQPSSPEDKSLSLDHRQVLAIYRQQIKQPPPSFVEPVQGRISSHFGWREHPILQIEKFHHGLDIAAPEGTLIRAAAPGRVIFSGEQGGYGNMVILEHPDGYTTRYAHNSVNLVHVGEQVEQAQPIARVGQTGRVTGPHLHFEIRKDGQAFDPMTLLSWRRSG